jgi:hypothetical protein
MPPKLNAPTRDRPAPPKRRPPTHKSLSTIKAEKKKDVLRQKILSHNIQQLPAEMQHHIKSYKKGQVKHEAKRGNKAYKESLVQEGKQVLKNYKDLANTTANVTGQKPSSVYTNYLAQLEDRMGETLFKTENKKGKELDVNRIRYHGAKKIGRYTYGRQVTRTHTVIGDE